MQVQINRKKQLKYMVHNFSSDGTFLASVQLPINDESLISCTLVNASVCSLHSPHQPQSQFLYHQHQSLPAPPRGDCGHCQWPVATHPPPQVISYQKKKKRKNSTHPHQPPPPTNNNNNNILYLLTWTTNKVFYLFISFYEVPCCI